MSVAPIAPTGRRWSHSRLRPQIAAAPGRRRARRRRGGRRPPDRPRLPRSPRAPRPALPTCRQEGRSAVGISWPTSASRLAVADPPNPRRQPPRLRRRSRRSLGSRCHSPDARKGSDAHPRRGDRRRPDATMPATRIHHRPPFDRRQDISPATIGAPQRASKRSSGRQRARADLDGNAKRAKQRDPVRRPRRRRYPVGFWSVAGRSPWRATTASSRASRSGRSPSVSAARRRRSRRTSMTRPARRRGRSRPAKSGGVPGLRRVHAAAERQGRATAYRKACHPGAIEHAGPGSACSTPMPEWRRRYGRLPSSYDWSRTHARRARGEALKRLAEGDWPAASVVSRVFGAWAAASAAG